MRIRFLVFVFLLLGSSQLFTASAQIKLLTAQLVSTKDSTVIPGVNVINMNTLNYTYSYSDGTFLMPFTQGDTIRISHVKYEDKYLYTGDVLIPDAIQITIFMREALIGLDTFSVKAYQNKEAFAEDFKSQEVETEAVEVFQYEKPKKLEDVDTDLNAKIPLGSPISFLYNKYSKEAKEKKRLAKAQVQNEREKTIKARYNLEVIKEVLGITSDEEAQKFMDNCPLDDDYVYKATDYDIVKSILECQKNAGKSNKSK